MRLGTTPRACARDADCPLSRDQQKELLWSRVKDTSAKSFSGLLASLRNELSGDIAWNEAIAGQLGGKTRAQLKRSLMTLMDADEKFRDSIETLVRTDAEFSDARRAASAGACTSAGRCRAATVVPNTRPFDGTRSTGFSLLDESTVMYTRNGVTREAEALRCDLDINRAVCDAAHPLDAPLLSAGDPVQTSYRMSFPGTDAEYVVMNHLAARERAQCAARVCEHNQDQCPASVCRVDEDNRCVAK